MQPQKDFLLCPNFWVHVSAICNGRGLRILILNTKIKTALTEMVKAVLCLFYSHSMVPVGFGVKS